MEHRRESNASRLSGVDVIDLILIAKEFMKEHPREVQRLIELGPLEPLRPDEQSDYLIEVGRLGRLGTGTWRCVTE